MASTDLIHAIAREFKGTKSGKGWVIHCPSHKDKDPSCSLNEGFDGKILVTCHAGCSQENIIDELKKRNLWPKKEKPLPLPKKKTAEYFYNDENGLPRLRIDRLESAFDKTFRQYHFEGGQWFSGKGEGIIAPYKFEVWKKFESVILVEGEKCVEALHRAGINYATCIPGGAKAWGESYRKFFKDKTVAILPDQDESGESFSREVANDLLPFASSIRVVEIPGLKKKQDVADWLAEGNGIDALRDLIKSTPEIKRKLSNWKSLGEDVLIERERRKKSTENKIEFGNQFLEKSLVGIFPGDLILVGAATGGGKTELLTSIASNAIFQMKKVYHFALEAEYGEITTRLKFKRIANRFYRDPRFAFLRQSTKLNFVEWYLGALENKTSSLLFDLEKEVTDEMAFENENYMVFYKTKADFTADILIKEIEAIKDDADLILIDHFHFLDFNDENENRAMTKAASMLRTCALTIKKPIILAAHVRKAERKGGPLLPGIEDFHGTSNLAKICTKALMVGPANFAIDSSEPTLIKTLMRVCKFRWDNSRSRYAGLVTFDLKTNSYLPDFQLGKFSKDGTQFDPILNLNEVPQWAKG